MQQAQIERAVLVQERLIQQPVEQKIAVGCRQYIVQRIAAAQARAPVRNGQQVQIVIAQGDRGGASHGADAPQDLAARPVRG